MQISYNKVYTTSQAQAIINGINDKIDSSIYISEDLGGGVTVKFEILPNGSKFSYCRNVGKRITNGETIVDDEYITYLKVGDHATNLPSTVRHKNTLTKYKYDKMGNISEVYENGKLVTRYTYDTIGRLVREDNRDFGYTFVFVYDNSGNILFRKYYPFTLKDNIELEEMTFSHDEFIYENNRINNKQGSFVYDEMGNIISYYGTNLTWTRGNRLASFGNNTFTYDALGNRVTKNDIRFLYDNSGNLIAEITNNAITKEFYYDHTGVFAMFYNGSTYYYRKNPLGDITALLDSDGNIVVQYKYNAWGGCKVLNASGTVITDYTHIGHINPFRYRSYYYDTETGLYYLKNRYYDPALCRFISMDDISFADPDSINGLNLYAYCGNNPVMNVDPTGNAVVSILIGLGIAALIGAGASAVTYTAVQVAQYAVTGTFEWSWGGFLGSVIGGALAGAISYIPFLNPIVLSAIGGFAVSAGGMIGENISDNKGYSVADILVVSAVSALLAGATAGITKYVKDPVISMGRNSFKAIEAQIFTKFRNGTISRITMNTFMKIFAYSIYKDMPGIFFDLTFEQSGFKNFIKKFVP